MNKAIYLPEKTRERLESLLRSQQQIQQAIDLVLATARELLDVPDDWQMGEVRQGFRPPMQEPPA